MSHPFMIQTALCLDLSITSSSSTDLKLLEQDLAGRNAIVTGGIGREIAFHLASRGASVVGTCSSPNSLHHLEHLDKMVTSEYKESGFHPIPRIIGVPANLLSPDTPQVMLKVAKREFGGKLDILVNNAAYDEMRQIGALDAEYVQRSLFGNIQTLVMSVDLLFKEAVFQPNSRIVNSSAELTRGPLPHSSFGLFAATKSALESLTRTWADVFGNHPSMAGTTVNVLLVGATDTEAFCKGLSPEQSKAVVDHVVGSTSVARLGTPQDVADLVGLLVSERAGWITGSVVGVNGGSAKFCRRLALLAMGSGFLEANQHFCRVKRTALAGK